MAGAGNGLRIAIVGAGPTGLTAAILLRRKGIEATLFERKAGTCLFPQAHVINTRTSEILREMQLFDTVAVAAAPAERVAFVTWSGALQGPRFGRLAYQGNSGQIAERRSASPTRTLNIGQDRLERILLDEYIALGGEVLFDHEVTRADTVANLPTLDIRHDEAIERRTYDYVLACDGANSIVRRDIGIAMEGPPSLARFATAYFEADLDAALGSDLGPVHFIAGPDVRGAIIGFDIARCWAFMCVIPPNGDPAQFTPDVMRELIRRATGMPDIAIDLSSVGSWNMSAQVAERFGSGGFLLLGDAAHRFPPTGGLGLNTGMGDAHNIAWKLALLARGEASANILASYESERRPVACRNRDHSMSNAMRMVEVDAAIGLPTLAPVNPEVVKRLPTPVAPFSADVDVARATEIQQRIDDQRAHFDSLHLEIGYRYGALEDEGGTLDDADAYRRATVGARLPHIWLDGAAQTRSTLDLVDGNNFALLTAGDVSGWRASISSIASLPVQVVGIMPPASVGGAAEFVRTMLIRPDGHIAWIGASEPDSAALAEIEKVIRKLIGNPS